MTYNIRVVYDCMKIRIYTHNFIYISKLGGGFGHSVCVADVNGDSYDDVLIGAPLEYINESNRNIVIDSGAVYIYLGTGTPVSHLVLITYSKYECQLQSCPFNTTIFFSKSENVEHVFIVNKY